MGVSFYGGVVGGASHLSSTLTDEKVHLGKDLGEGGLEGDVEKSKCKA